LSLLNTVASNTPECEKEVEKVAISLFFI